MCLLGIGAAFGRSPRRHPFPAPPLGRIPWPDGVAAGATIRWTGVAGLRFDLGGVAVAFDPFVTRPGTAAVLFRRPRPDAAAAAARFADLDAVFVGHAHHDHAMDLGVVHAASPRATVCGGPTAVELARRLGVAADRLRVVADGDAVEVGPFRVEVLRSAHGRVPLVSRVDRAGLPRHGLPRTPFRYPRGEVLAFRVEAAGRVFHVQGSAGLDEEALARRGPADLLLPCLAARRGTPAYLERLGARLRPAFVIPIHHDDLFRPLDEAPRPVATLAWPEYERDLAALAAAHGTRGLLLPRDEPVAW